MFSIALIGGDGAGKTTIAKSVIQSSITPVKYLYMGLSTRSSNYALPTSQAILFIKQQMHKKKVRNTSIPSPEGMSANQLEYSKETHGWVWNTARFLNRLAEAWYRQLISIFYQIRGYVVIYDRHFLFDSAPEIIDSRNQSLIILDRLYFWIMSHWYPKPSLTIFLDAPPDLLYHRKGEASPEYLDHQRTTYLEQGKKLSRFRRVDASQPLDKVLIEVVRNIKDFYPLE